MREERRVGLGWVGLGWLVGWFAFSGYFCVCVGFGCFVLFVWWIVLGVGVCVFGALFCFVFWGIVVFVLSGLFFWCDVGCLWGFGFVWGVVYLCLFCGFSFEFCVCVCFFVSSF